MPKTSYEAQKSRLITINYEELDDALMMARNIANRDGVPWEIEGDDGSLLDRDAIVKLVRERAAILAKRRKLY